MKKPAEINIKFVVSEIDPMINISSEAFPLEYTHASKKGSLYNFHGLQCGWVESDNPKKYKRLLRLCDTIADASREIRELHL